MNTKNNKKNLGLLARAQNSLVGKTLRRLMGEETGAVTMEYLVIAVLIVAATALSAWYFGQTLRNEIRVASDAVVAHIDNAVDHQNQSQELVGEGYTSAQQPATNLIKADANGGTSAATIQ